MMKYILLFAAFTAIFAQDVDQGFLDDYLNAEIDAEETAGLSECEVVTSAGSKTSSMRSSGTFVEMMHGKSIHTIAYKGCKSVHIEDNDSGCWACPKRQDKTLAANCGNSFVHHTLSWDHKNDVARIIMKAC